MEIICCDKCKFSRKENDHYVWCKKKMNRTQISKIKECRLYEEKQQIQEHKNKDTIRDI